MKKLSLTKKERERLELKFECIRRDEKYLKDYELQQEHKRPYESYKKLESFFYPKWLHFPLLNPDIPIKYYRNKKNYSYWLEKTLGGLITSDSLCVYPLKINSPELRKYLLWKKRGYKTLVNPKKGRVAKIVFPKEKKAYNVLNVEKVEKELRDVKLSLDLYGMEIGEIVKYVKKLLKELKPLADRFLHKKYSKEKHITIRKSAIPFYLKKYDEKKNKSHPEMSKDENQQRKFKKQLRAVRTLIKGGWHYI